MADHVSDPLASTEILFDGIEGIKIIEGVVRISLFARRRGERTIVARLAIPVSELPDVIQAMVMSMTEAARNIVKPPLSN